VRRFDCDIDSFGLYAGLLFEPAFFAAVAISLIFNPWFDYKVHTLSDLGAMSSNNGWIFNLGMMISGALGAVFSWRVLVKQNYPLWIYGYIMLISAIIMILIGLFPDDLYVYVIPNTVTVHKFLSILGALLSSIGMLLYAIYWIKKERWIKLGVSLLGFGFGSAPLAAWIGHPSIALIEISFSLTIMLWAYITIHYLCTVNKNDTSD